MRRIKMLLLIAFAALAHSTWKLVRLAHSTLPAHPADLHESQQLPNHPRSTTNGVPFLPPLPRVDPIPAQSLVRSWMKSTGNETAGQFLLDFAIIGNAKCGTSTIMNWLYEHPQIQIPRDELYHLKSKEAWDLVGVFYEYFGVGKLRAQSIKGYKSPSDITNERAIRLLRTYFPQTKLLIGLRHPVFMLESFYNFRIQNGYELPPLEKLHYRNLANQYGVSWSRADYHTSLMFLGKTNLTTPEERALMPPPARKQIQKQLDKRNNLTAVDKGNQNGNNDNPPYVKVPNSVFLYDTAQLGDVDNPARLDQFGQDIANYLGLREKLPPPPRHSPGKQLQNTTLQAERNAKKIHICDERYVEQRKQLLQIGERTAKWILEYFLPSGNVYVSNREHFRELLLGYSQDPCVTS